MDIITRQSLAYAVYFAPRGKTRLLNIGNLLAQRYLSPVDKLIGFIGDAGAGKSLLIKGMFPGLELTNDDEGINIRPLPLLKTYEKNHFASHTYHVDIRFESAFTQMHVLVDAIKMAIEGGKRVIVEHFDLLYPHIKMNAEIIIGVGEEIIVTRPSIFGPIPEDIATIVFNSIKYRQMAHSAEDITCMILQGKYNMDYQSMMNTDVKHGFVLEFKKKPDIDLVKLEEEVLDYINQGLDICYFSDTHIRIGENKKQKCTGPRIHVSNTDEIENFSLLKDFKFDPITKTYSIVGLVGDERPVDLNDLNKLNL
jgi:tRNA A37 threonylcarbamoyladenosine biosynthesis protein TsaE